MPELIISIAALALILFFGRRGWRHGFFRSASHLLIVLFAILWALRWWHPYTGWLAERLNQSPDQLAFAAFWFVFAVFYIPLNALAGALNNEFVPVYPFVVERVGGFAATALSTALLCSVALLSLLPWLPKIHPAYDPSRLLLPLDRLPLAIYRGIEEKAVSGVPAVAPSRTLLPELKGSGDRLKVNWN